MLVLTRKHSENGKIIGFKFLNSATGETGYTYYDFILNIVKHNYAPVRVFEADGPEVILVQGSLKSRSNGVVYDNLNELSELLPSELRAIKSKTLNRSF